MLPLLPGEMDLRSLQQLLGCLGWLQARGALGATLAPPWRGRDATTAPVAAIKGIKGEPCWLFGADKHLSQISSSTDGRGGH